MSDFSSAILASEFDLNARTLVEASAGTGKTYNIQNVYLRLVLEQGLTVEEILVVTYTEAATHELRDRLRRILTKAALCLKGRLADEDEDRPRIKDILGAARDRIQCAGSCDEILGTRLQLALMDFDNAAIFTIHGFCNRVLERYAFECGHDPEAELVPDESEIVRRVTRDWWRQHTYRDAGFAGRVAFSDVEELDLYVQAFLRRPDACLLPASGAGSSTWPEAARALAAAAGDVLSAIADTAEDSAKPSADARALLDSAIPDLLEAIRNPDTVDLADVRAHINSMLQGSQKAYWDEVPGDFPDAVQDVLAAAKDAWGRIGALTGKIEWTAPGVLQRAKNPPVSLIPLAEAARSRHDEVKRWLENPGQAKKKIAFQEAVEGFEGLFSVGREWAETGAAKDFCKKVLKPLGTLTPAGAFYPVKVSAEEKLPQLMETLRTLRESILAVMSETVRTIVGEVRSDIRARNVITYSDMLGNVRNALESAQGPQLCRVLREEFKAALVDEFQDTDPVQFEIFDRIFPTGPDEKHDPVPLFFVGDPKQAIYGFRGGDVFMYYRAKDTVLPGRCYNLPTNYRSEAALVAACNELFADVNGPGSTFRNEYIPYAGDLLSAGRPPARSLTVGGQPDEQPLKLWRYSCSNNRLPGMTSPFALQTYIDTAEEIVRLLQDPDIRIAGEPVRSRDIAVLVLKHKEAAYLHAELLKRGVHAVRQNTGNIFETDEAAQLALVMRAMFDPADAYAVRGAMATSLLPCGPDNLQALCEATADAPGISENMPCTLDDWMAVFRDAGDRWRQRSFIDAFRLLTARLQLRTHLAGRGSGGERALTNLLHLVELAHQAAAEFHEGPVGLMNWFVRQLDETTRDRNDEFEMRLSSDEDAVRIMTVHTSKGLEFPIVFVPTAYRMQAAKTHGRDVALTCHDENHDIIMHLDLDHPQYGDRALDECLQEDLRKLYVAVTRAIHRVYLFAIVTDPTDALADSCALARILSARGLLNGEGVHIETSDRAENESVSKNMTLLSRPAEDPQSLHARPLPEVNRSHGHTSFSALEPAARPAGPVRDRDAGLDGPGEGAGMQAQQAVEHDIFSIPGGARTGDCWHGILEQIQFSGPPEDRYAIIEDALTRTGICRGPVEAVTRARHDAVHDMIGRVIEMPMTVQGPQETHTLVLNSLEPGQYRSEFAFDLRLKQSGPLNTTAALREVLSRHWKDEKHAPFISSIENWNREIPQGYLTGFIDLLCCSGERFYILDWKSNRRSGRLRDFEADGLADEMRRHAYFLQYLLYTVAVDRFLGQTLESYDYDRHFGGVFYVFLRGAGAPGGGVFADRPSRALVRELGEALTGDAS